MNQSGKSQREDPKPTSIGFEQRYSDDSGIEFAVRYSQDEGIEFEAVTKVTFPITQLEWLIGCLEKIREDTDL